MLRHNAPRRGVILIVVLALLTLFAIVGITFVMVAGASAEKQRILRDAAGGDTGPPFTDDGTAAFRAFLSGLIYDVADDATGLQSSIRGHSLVATMYGRYGAQFPLQGGATVAWNGIGTFSEPATTAGINRQILLNYRQWPGITQVYDPEFSGERALGGTPGSTPGSVYIPKNAPYTYPDFNNLFLASICPATGEVLTPSFFRAAAFGSLDPNNPNWTNAQGKYLILRPRPQEHPSVGGRPGFSSVPRNADGTYTGDVQNLTGGYVYDPVTKRFTARNDSIWIDIGAPPLQGRDGRRYKMLVAPLILDLDGRINMSVAGNRMMPITPPPAYPDNAVHTSGDGIGPWEISLERLFGANSGEARRIVAARNAAITRAAQTDKRFAPNYGANQEIPKSAQVAWSGFDLTGAGKALQFPADMYSGQPNFTNGYNYFNAPAMNHPSLFSTTEWQPLPSGATGLPRWFSLADTKLLSLRHAFAPFFYQGAEVSSFAPITLVGTIGVPNPNPPQQTTQNGYRLDPAHTIRNLLTTLSADLDRPAQMSGQLANPYSVLGGIDLNRTLADYRQDTAQPLVPVNMLPPSIVVGTATMTQADIDRNRLAKDIFARLVVSTGPAAARVITLPTEVIGGATYQMGDVYVDDATYPPGSPEFNIVRGLAQLAVNIVDYIDADDVITSFVWKPLNPADPYAPTNYAPAELGNRVVFGTEKPRFTLSEGYVEVVNDPSDPGLTNMTGPTFKPNVRCWFEFRNASTAPYSASINGPQGDGAVRLQYDPATEQGALPVVDPYRVEIVRNGKGGVNNSDLLRNPANAVYAANVTGAILAPDLSYGFTQSSAAGVPRVIPPANGAAAGPSTVVAAANFTPTTGSPEFNPAKTGWNVINTDPFPGAGSPLAFVSDIDLATSLVGDILNPGYQHYTVVLRRLANPNLPASPTNPYITIDVLDHVRAADRIMKADKSATPRSPKMTAGGMGYDPNGPPAVAGDPDLRPQSSGKVQPYASFSAPPPAAFPNSMVLLQDPATVGMGAEGVRHTLNRQNSRADVAPTTATYVPGNPAAMTDANLTGETIMTPHDWLVHLDRPIINPMELLHVTAGKPHELTLQFLVPDSRGPTTGHDVYRSAGSAWWLPATPPHPFLTIPNHPNSLYPTLYRGLDLLRNQPYGHLTPPGGRILGKLNLNTIQDDRVFRALFDAQPGNGFNDAFVTSLWTDLMTSRSGGTAPVAKFGADGVTTFSSPVIGPTIYDTNTATGDRPFLPLGAPTIPAGGSTLAPGVTAFNGGIGLQDTILRPVGSTDPRIWVGTAGVDHPYQRAEAVRKIMNNTTTVSNVFAVWVTVGYFEVNTDATGQDVLGKEYYLEVPSDMRQKLFAIVDRTRIGLEPAGFTASPPVIAQQTMRPFDTTLEVQNVKPGDKSIVIYAPNGQVWSDGVPVTLTDILLTGKGLAIGDGPDREILMGPYTIKGDMIGNTPAPGYTTIELPLAGPASFQKNHAIGTKVTNFIPGNPGPQNFALPMDDTSPYRMVVPHWSKVQ